MANPNDGPTRSEFSRRPCFARWFSRWLEWKRRSARVISTGPWRLLRLTNGLVLELYRIADGQPAQERPPDFLRPRRPFHDRRGGESTHVRQYRGSRQTNGLA